MGDDGLQPMEVAVSKPLPLHELVVKTSQTFEQLKMWHDVKVEAEVFKPIVRRVNQEAIAFYQGIDLSMVVAQEGYSMADDAEFLCQEIRKEATTVEERKEMIEDLIQSAKIAEGAAKDLGEKFRVVRRAVVKLQRDLKGAVSQMANEAKAAEDNARASNAKVKKAAVLGSLATGAATLLFPHLAPLAGLLGAAVADGHRDDAKTYGQQALERRNGIDMAGKLEDQLIKLIVCVDGFVAYWQEIVTLLETLKGKQDILKTRMSSIKAKQCEQKWKELKAAYSLYKIQITRLQDHYPSTALAAISDRSYMSQTARNALVGRPT